MLTAVVHGGGISSRLKQSLRYGLVALATGEVERCLSVGRGSGVHLGSMVEKAQSGGGVPIAAGREKRGVSLCTYPVYICREVRRDE